jgi:hypothetical protein
VVRPGTTVLLAIGLLMTSCLTLVASAGAQGPSVTPLTAATKPAVLTLARLEADITSSADLQQAPNLSSTIPPVSQMEEQLHYGIPSSAFYKCFSSTTFPTKAATTCAWGDTTSTKTILLVGDSQAAQWLPAISQLGVAQKMKVILVAGSACAPFAYLEPVVPGSPTAECRDFSQSELNLAKAIKPEIVIVIGTDNHYGDYPPANEVAWYETVVARYRQLKAHVILFGATPWLYRDTASGPVEVNPNTCISEEPSALTDCDPPASASQGLLARLVAAGSGATFFDVTPLFCTSKVCPVIVADKSGDHLVLFDDKHVSNTYFDWIYPAFAPLFGYAMTPSTDAKQAALVISGGSPRTGLSGTVTLATTGGSGGGTVTYSALGANCTISYATLSALAGSSCTVTAVRSASGKYAVAYSKPVKFEFS